MNRGPVLIEVHRQGALGDLRRAACLLAKSFQTIESSGEADQRVRPTFQERPQDLWVVGGVSQVGCGLKINRRLIELADDDEGAGPGQKQAHAEYRPADD